MGEASTVARTVVVFASSSLVTPVFVSVVKLSVVFVWSRDGSLVGGTDMPSAKATNEVARFLSGFDDSAGDIVDITTPKSAAVGASCQHIETSILGYGLAWFDTKTS